MEGSVNARVRFLRRRALGFACCASFLFAAHCGGESVTEPGASSAGVPNVGGNGGASGRAPSSSGGAGAAGEGGEGAGASNVGGAGTAGASGASGALGGNSGTNGDGGDAGTPAGTGGEGPVGCDPTRIVTGDLELDSQAAVDDLRGVGIIDGDLTLGRALDLRPLECLTTIIGTLHTGRTGTLDGLQHLVSVGGDLILSNRSGMSHVDELSGLRAVGGNLIALGTSLTSLDGFSNLRTIGGNLEISGNESLQTLEAFGSLASVRGSLTFREFCHLPYECSTNLELIALRGFPRLEWVGGDLELRVLGVENIEAFPMLTTVEGVVSISGNPSLTSLDGLRSLTSVGGLVVADYGYWIEDDLGPDDEGPSDIFVDFRNYSLIHLDSLAGLQTVHGALVIETNPALRNVRGLASVLRVGSLSIVGNPLLPTCEAEWLRDNISTSRIIDGTVVIADTDDLGICPP